MDGPIPVRLAILIHTLLNDRMLEYPLLQYPALYFLPFCVILSLVAEEQKLEKCITWDEWNTDEILTKTNQ